MAKKDGKTKRDPEEQARKRLARAQIELHVAQERRAEAIRRGERLVERARQKAARWQQKATERVERQAGAVVRAEAKLVGMTGDFPRRVGRGLSRSRGPDRDRTRSAPPAGEIAPWQTPGALTEDAGGEAKTGPLVLPGEGPSPGGDGDAGR